MSLLAEIKSPADVKKLSDDQLVELAGEVRERLIHSVSETGGHFASNLGAVELTVALVALCDLPRDKILWDVSHQTYPYKILTGRNDRMDTIRQYGGLSGFASRAESEYDAFGAAHASTSISAALGFACARDNLGQDYRVITVTGDGAMTGGLTDEGLNNLGETRKDMLIILNDNTWSISKNVGAISKYLTGIMADQRYNKLRAEVWELTGRFKRREKIRQAVRKVEESIKGFLVPGSFFEKLGIRYFGPIDGHDLKLLLKTLRELDTLKGPRLLHIATVKGKGYDPAEGDALKYHGVTKFDKINGKFAPKKASLPAYTKVFGDALIELGGRNKDLQVITAAMPTGAGVEGFGKKFPERFFDVGIAEAHGACFSAGLAAAGARPVFAVYSTFLQRAYDQVIHDIGIQNLPVVLCMDRGGLVGADGPTHHGVFDLSYLQAVPNFTICAPKDGNELRSMLRYSVEEKITGPIAMRYPRASTPVEITPGFENIEWGTWEELKSGETVCVLAVGTMVLTAMEATARLEALRGQKACVVNARFIKPLDTAMLDSVLEKFSVVITIEENVLLGGFGSTVGSYANKKEYNGRIVNIGVPDRFVTHGTIPQLWVEIGLDVDSILAKIQSAFEQCAPRKSGFFSKLTLKRSARTGNGSERQTTNGKLSTDRAERLLLTNKETGLSSKESVSSKE